MKTTSDTSRWRGRTLLSVIVTLGLLLTACHSGGRRTAQEEAALMELRSQVEELQRLRTSVDAERQRFYRAVAGIQSRIEELDRTLNMASAEIWGDGSPTSARLATAQRSLASIRTEVEGLASELRSAIRGK